MTRTLRVKVTDNAALLIAQGLKNAPEALIAQAACIEILLADRQRLAKALHFLLGSTEDRDVAEIATVALADCGLLDPPAEDQA